MKALSILTSILFFSIVTFAYTVDTVMVYSVGMRKNIPNLVILPEGYKSQTTNFPVLYLLHGAGGDYKSWLTNMPDLGGEVDKYNLVFVCPDGGGTSWYFDSPVDTSMKYETYITSELVKYIDRAYRTIEGAKGRAITGYSMGGHGAFYLSFKHQEVWGAAGSMSGGMDIRPFPENWDIAKRLGPLKKQAENWDKNTVINMTQFLEGGTLKLIFDCGVDDFFYTVNKSLHEKLLKSKIHHNYTEKPCYNGWDYWEDSFRYQLLFFNKYFDSENRK